MGADIHKANSLGETPLHTARSKQKWDVVWCMVANGHLSQTSAFDIVFNAACHHEWDIILFLEQQTNSEFRIQILFLSVEAKAPDYVFEKLISHDVTSERYADWPYTEP